MYKQDYCQSAEQAGFRKKLSTADQIFILNQIIHRKGLKYNLEINLMFID